MYLLYLNTLNAALKAQLPNHIYLHPNIYNTHKAAFYQI